MCLIICAKICVIISGMDLYVKICVGFICESLCDNMGGNMCEKHVWKNVCEDMCVNIYGNTWGLYKNRKDTREYLNQR